MVEVMAPFLIAEVGRPPSPVPACWLIRGVETEISVPLGARYLPSEFQTDVPCLIARIERWLAAFRSACVTAPPDWASGTRIWEALVR